MFAFVTFTENMPNVRQHKNDKRQTILKDKKTKFICNECNRFVAKNIVNGCATNARSKS